MKKNIIANVFGRVWGVLSNFLFIPLYIKYLGFESYSVISFTLLLAGVMAILDSGLTATLSREFARTDNSKESKQKIYKSLESAYLFTILLCLGIIIIFSQQIAENLHLKTYSSTQIVFFLRIVSVDIAFQLIFRFYMGGLFGLEKQVSGNLYQVFWGVMRNAVAVLIIYFYPSLTLFFIWQSFTTVFVAFLLKSKLDRIVFDKVLDFSFKIDGKIFSEVWKFAGGMMLISLIAALNTQMDKIVISKLMSLENLGYYTIAVSISQGLLVIVNPIATAILPRFTSFYSSNQMIEARKLFNLYSAIASILIFSFLGNLMFYSKEILWVWTGDLQLAGKIFMLIPIVAASYAFIALQVIPYHVAIANGHTKLNNMIGIISVFITIPGYWFGIKYYGAVGAATVFLIVQLFTLIIYVFFINKKFIQEKIFRIIYLKHMVLPFLVSSTIAFVLHNIAAGFLFQYRIASLCMIGLSTLITLITCGLILLSKEELNSIYKSSKTLL